MATGSMILQDLLAIKYQSVSLLDFGLDRMNELAQASLAAHNNLLVEQTAYLAEATTERYRVYGGQLSNKKMKRVGQFGRVETRKPPMQTGEVGFPMYRFQEAIGWNRDWFASHTPYDMARLLLDLQDAHTLTVQDHIKWALYSPTNITGYQDEFVDDLTFTIRRLLNADSSPIPATKNNVTFDGSTHTHYLASAALDNTALKALEATVREHEPAGEILIFINRANEDTVRGLADFKGFTDVRIVQPSLSSDVYGPTRLDPYENDNKPIGVFKSATVWLKPWALNNYPLCLAPTAPRKPLAYRRPVSGPVQGLRIAAEFDTFPLHSQFIEDQFGFAVQQREAAAVLYVGGGAYVDPGIVI